MTTPFDPVSFERGPSMPNRFMLSPLTNLQSHADGTLSDEEFHWLTMRGKGGFGLTMTCSVHVQQIGQGFPGQLGIFSDDHLPGLTRLAAALTATGTLPAVQLHHAGDRAPAELVGTRVSCSENVADGVRALTLDEIAEVREAYVAAARRAIAAGFRCIEVHGAHGYLLTQFLSTDLNRRTDQYGGSLENRSRLLHEVIGDVRAACGDDVVLAVRLTPERFGVVLDEAVEVYRTVVERGLVDLIDMSLWDAHREPEDERFKGRSIAAVFAEKPRGSVRLAVAGKIRTRAEIDAMLDLGVDVVALGRAGILHHDYPARMAADPEFTPRRTPVSAEVLRSEGASPVFVDYLRKFKMVDETSAATDGAPSAGLSSDVSSTREA